MCNVLDAIGYANEKVHTGMIVYLCDLFNAGNREPLRSFFNAFPVEGADQPIVFEDEAKVWARKEYRSLDLTIEKNKKPYIGIEMKVDSHEGGNQTVKYCNAFRDNQEMHYFFITLGMGEYCKRPVSKQFRWVKLNDCLKAVESIKQMDGHIQDGLALLKREQALRDACREGNREFIEQYLPGQSTRTDFWRDHGWNLCFLGLLKEALPPIIYEQWHVYMYGSGPDTILNLGAGSHSTFIELHTKGLLLLKVWSKQVGDIQRVMDCYQLESESKGVYLVTALSPAETQNIRSKSKTLKKYNIGVVVNKKDGIMHFCSGVTREQVAKRLEYLTKRMNECWEQLES